MSVENDALRWNLSDLYASATSPELEKDIEKGKALALDFAARFRGRVASLSEDELAQAISAFEALMETVYRPQLFASLQFAGQTDDEKAQALLNHTQQASMEAFNEVKFFEVELKQLPEDVFEKHLKGKSLARYTHFLRAQRKFAPYTLSEAEEQLSDLKSLTGKQAFSQLYTEVSSRIRIPLEVEGQKKDWTVAEVRAMRSSSDRDLRRRATDGLMKAFEEQSHVLNFCFNTLYQEYALDIEKRGYKTVAEPTFLEDELTSEVVENLLSTTEKHYPLAQRYMRLKAKVLGLKDFSSHDVLAPLEKAERKVSFEEGRRWVLDAFSAFTPEMGTIAKSFFDNRWIDVLPRPGKRDGAFCSGMLPSLHPYVLLNYNERIEDVSTLAHELGHGIHFYLSRRNSPLNFWPTTPMAETASVFGELVLMKRLMEKETDKQVRRNLLALRIEDILATVFNQVAYTRWEQKAHARRAEGVVPTEDFSSLWMSERKRLYGDSVAFLPQDRWGWISIPHFVHYRFYCYSYAFGQLLVLALFGKYEEEGASFIPKYLELLASGGSDTPQNLLQKVGIDVMANSFWEQGFVTLKALLDEFEALMA